MATKKSTDNKSNRQRTKRSLPVKASAKKPSRSKKETRAKQKVRKKRPVAKRTPRSKTIIRSFSLSVWPNTILTIQLKSTKKLIKKSRARGRTHSHNILATISRQKTKLPHIFIASGLVGTIYFATDILRPAPELTVYSPPAPAIQAAPLPQLAAKTYPRSEPISLSVPDIGLDVSLINVGKKADNTLEVPKSAEVPGWYRLSPTPGELGPSIIVGHVDSPKGPAVFWRLRELKNGQFIEIKRADKTAVRFKVTSVQQFEQDNFPTQEVYGTIKHAGLRLITCGGSYNRLTGEYSHNTVVFAELDV